MRIKKSVGFHKKKRYVLCGIMSLILALILAFIPFENLFITFSSAEAAYKYVDSTNPDVQLVVEGKKADLVVGAENEKNEYLIIPKNEEGWKIGLSVNTRRIEQKIIDDILIRLYQYKHSNEYFLAVFNVDGGMCLVEDNQGSLFSTVEYQNEALEKTFITYFAYVNKMDAQYKLYANGEEDTFLNSSAN